MKKYNFSICIIFCLLGFSKIFAQESLKNDNYSKEIELLNIKAEGTYQIQIIDSREMPSIPFDFVNIVESKRDSIKTVLYYLKPSIRVKILPYKTINSNQFKKLTPVVYLNSNSLNSNYEEK
jgi:hypothetical protein